MAWISVSMEVDAASADALADALLAQGALAVDAADADAGTAAEVAIFREPGATGENAWPRTRLSALFDPEPSPLERVRAALEAIGVAPPQLTEIAVGDADWVRLTQQQFGPIRISERLWIVPSWSPVPDARALNLRLDPGLAFGTGGHPTTAQCLRWLEQNLKPGQRVLDYGCGSGILAIAAKRMGAGQVVALDIDPAALAASRANAVRNAVIIDVVGPEHVPDGPYDVVLANILANPLRVLAPLLAGYVRGGGALVLAGVLDEQAEELMQLYQTWCEMRIVSSQGGWACLEGIRRK
jgi:ribosomal protein L11 methyltransferase